MRKFTPEEPALMRLPQMPHASKAIADKRKDDLVHSSFVDHSNVPQRDNLKTMRFRCTHLACLLLLLSSLAVSDARAASVRPSPRPNDVFVRKLLLQATAQPQRPNLERAVSPVLAAVTVPMLPVMHWLPGPVTTQHMFMP